MTGSEPTVVNAASGTAGDRTNHPSDPPSEVAELRKRLREAEQTLRAIHQGGIDSLVVGPAGHQQVYMLSTADRPYRLIVAGMGEGAATVAASGTILYANARLAALVGRPVNALVGTSVLDLAAGADQANLSSLIKASPDRTLRGQLEFNGADGTSIPVAVAVSAVDLDPTTSIRCLIATDLTTVREAERDLSRSHAALREREAFLEQATQMVGLGTWEAESAPDGPLTWSSNVYRITGHNTDNYDPRVHTYLDLVHPDDRQSVAQAFTDAMTGSLPLRVKHRIMWPDGQVHWVEQAAVLEQESGVSPRLLGVIQDITEQVEAQQTARHRAADMERLVARRTAELTTANRDLEALTRSISHDLRAPLRAITTFSETLLERHADELSEKGRYYASRIHANGQHMAELLDALLQMSRMSRAEMRIQQVDLSVTARTILTELSEREPHRHVQGTIQDDMHTAADPSLIRNVLENLLGNAWKFTSKRDEATIEFGSQRADDHTTNYYYIRDNGAGFAPDLSNRLFQPFQRLHTAEDFTGTGIGLASTRQIIERHNGRIWAESIPEHGATFFFTLNASNSGPH